MGNHRDRNRDGQLRRRRREHRPLYGWCGSRSLCDEARTRRISPTGALTIANNAITTAKITDAAVTYAKMQNVAASRLLGNATAATPGAPAEILLGTGLSFSGGNTLNAAGTVSSIGMTVPGAIFGVQPGIPHHDERHLQPHGQRHFRGVPYFNSTSTMCNQRLAYGKCAGARRGAGGPPAPMGSLGTALQVLHGNAGGAPTWSTLSLTTEVSGTLQAAQEPAHTGEVTNTAGSLALTITNAAVTYAKMQAMTANRLLGSGLSGTAVAEITLGTNLSLTGTTLNAAGGVSSIGMTVPGLIFSVSAGLDHDPGHIRPDRLGHPRRHTLFQHRRPDGLVSPAHRQRAGSRGGAGATPATMAPGTSGQVLHSAGAAVPTPGCRVADHLKWRHAPGRAGARPYRRGDQHRGLVGADDYQRRGHLRQDAECGGISIARQRDGGHPRSAS